MKQDNVSAGQRRELDNPQLICERRASHFHAGTLSMTTGRPTVSAMQALLHYLPLLQSPALNLQPRPPIHMQTTRCLLLTWHPALCSRKGGVHEDRGRGAR
jgi:hypothetical protein